LYRPPTTEFSVLQGREETDLVYTFLTTVDSSYEAIRAHILLSTDKLTFDVVTSLVRKETTKQVAMGASESNPKPETRTFLVQHFSVGKDKGKKEIKRCSHCKNQFQQQK
jgi:hypothetical protein